MSGYQRGSNGGIDIETGLSVSSAKRARADGGVGGAGAIGIDGLQKPNIYYNGNIVNNNPPGANVPKSQCVAAFSDTRSAEVIRQNAQNYNLSLIRCGLTTKDIPMFIPKPIPNPYNNVDVNMLDYRVGTQVTTSGTLARNTNYSTLSSLGAPLALGDSSRPFNIGGAPRMSIFNPTGYTGWYNQNWDWSLTTLGKGGVWRETGSSGWVAQLQAASGNFSGAPLLNFNSAQMGSSVPGAPYYINIALSSVAILAGLCVKIDFSKDGTQDPSVICQALGIPLNTTIVLTGGTDWVNYAGPLGMQTGPGLFTYKLQSFSFLKWVPEDQTMNVPSAPPPPAPWSASVDYYDGAMVTYPAGSDNVYTARPGPGKVIPASTVPPTASGNWLFEGVPDWTSYRDNPYFWGYNYSSFLTNCVNPAIDKALHGVPYGVDPSSFTSKSIEAQFLAFQTAQATCVTPWSSSATYTMGTAVTYQSPQTLGNTVYLAQYDLPVGSDPPGVNQYWLLVGESFKQSWCSYNAYVIGQLVTYGGTVYYCTGNVTPSSPNPTVDTAHWTVGYAISYGALNGRVASASPYFTYNQSLNLFDLHEDTYSIYGAEDSQGLSGMVPCANNPDVTNPCFESLRLVSDFNFTGLFANFEQTNRVDDDVPTIWGGVPLIDPSLTVPPTRSSTSTASTNVVSSYLNAYPSRFDRLGIWVPGNDFSVIYTNCGQQPGVYHH